MHKSKAKKITTLGGLNKPQTILGDLSRPQTNFFTKIRSYRYDRDDSSSVRKQSVWNENKEKHLEKSKDRC